MIKMRLLIVLMMLLSFNTIGQTVSEPFKKANTILIDTKLTSDEAFTKWGRHLAQNGYSIDKSDNNFYTVTTGPKDTSKFNCDFILNSTVIDSGIVLIKIKWRVKSSILAGTSETEFYDWEYATGRNNVQNIIYQDLIKTIKSFGTYDIGYEKK